MKNGINGKYYERYKVQIWKIEKIAELHDHEL